MKDLLGKPKNKEKHNNLVKEIAEGIDKAKVKLEKEIISLCPNCNCMTKIVNGNCGKCGVPR